MTNQLSSLVRLRILVAHVGEAISEPWWPTQFTTYAGLEFAEQSFPRSWASAAINGACRAAQELGYCQIWWMGIPSESDPKRPVLLRPARRP
ncbi:MAG: BrxE family protein [Alkalispirochaeta sp.]